MKRLDLSRYAPLGFPVEGERNLYLTGLICSALFSMGFLLRYFSALDALYLDTNGIRELSESAVMPDFVNLLASSFLGFLMLSVAMLGFAAFHYAYHRQGSRAIYLMRRLPRRMELHRRCLTLPLLAVLGCFCSALFLLLLYFGIYMLFTPRQCLVPDQWGKIWRCFL